MIHVQSKKSPLFHYISDIELLPFSDLEASKILGITEKGFTNLLNFGHVKKTVPVLYRFDQNFMFAGLFDLLEYGLRRKFSFLVYKSIHEVDELVGSLVDEIANLIDISLHSEDKLIKMGDVIDNLQEVCRDNQEIWQNYWLYDGESFSAEKCANLTVQYWQFLFRKAILELEALGYSDIMTVGNSEVVLQNRTVC